MFMYVSTSHVILILFLYSLSLWGITFIRLFHSILNGLSGVDLDLGLGVNCFPNLYFIYIINFIFLFCLEIK